MCMAWHGMAQRRDQWTAVLVFCMWAITDNAGVGLDQNDDVIDDFTYRHS